MDDRSTPSALPVLLRSLLTVWAVPERRAQSVGV